MSLALSRNQLERQAWLHYYNRTLCEQGVISESEYRQMMTKINHIPAHSENNLQTRSSPYKNTGKTEKRYGER